MGVSSLFNCDGHVVFSSAYLWNQLIATAIPLPSMDDADSEHQQPETQLHPASITLTEAHEERAICTEEQFGFCPMSGRLVHIFGSKFEVRVEDFLLPPGP